MPKFQQFGKAELKAVEQAQKGAEELVGGFYVIAPREWERLHYEVRTLSELAPEEVCHQAFAQVLCYDCVRCIGADIIEHNDLYRICLQDHCLLRVARRGNDGYRLSELDLEPLLLYVLTHELVHVVRFSQHLQSLDLAPELRTQEEISVEQTTRQILTPVTDRALRRVIDACSIC